MPPIKFRERLTKFMISISLSEKFCCQNLITSIKVINMTRNSSKSNKLRNINITLLCVLEKCNLKYYGQKYASTDVQKQFWSSPLEVSKARSCYNFSSVYVCACAVRACVVYARIHPDLFGP